MTNTGSVRSRFPCSRHGVSAIDFAPDGTLFGIGYDNAGDYNLIEIDTTTGAGISRGRIKQLFWDEEGRGSFSATRTRCGAGEDLDVRYAARPVLPTLACARAHLIGAVGEEALLAHLDRHRHGGGDRRRRYLR